MAKKASKKASSGKSRAKRSGSKVKAKSKAKTKTTKVKSAKKVSKKKSTKKKLVRTKVAKKKVVKKKSVQAKQAKARKSSTKKKGLRVISTGAGAKLAGKVGSSLQASKTISTKKSRSESSPLRVEELDDFRTLLLKHRRTLLGNVARMRAEALEKNRQDAAGNLSKFPTSPADLGSDNYEMEFTLSMMEGERELLKEIDDALKRMDGSIYGICEATGESISRDRLQFEPWARYTVEYTSLLEKGLVSSSSTGPDESRE